MRKDPAPAMAPGLFYCVIWFFRSGFIVFVTQLRLHLRFALTPLVVCRQILAMKIVLQILSVAALALSLVGCSDDDAAMANPPMLWDLPGNGWDQANWL